MKVAVIYYDGNEHKAIVVETETPDSTASHVFGLSEEDEVLAVVTGISDETAIYIDEQNVIGE